MAKAKQIGVRVSDEDFTLITETAKKHGYAGYTDWVVETLLAACGQRSLKQEILLLKDRVEKLEKNQVKVV